MIQNSAQTEPYAERTDAEMKDVLMRPDAVGPRVHYYMIRGGSEKRNITVWQSGTVGDEYIKTYGHYHIKDFEETYQVIFGEGILLTQDRKEKNGVLVNDELASVKAIFLRTGQRYTIPPRSGHLMLNIGKTWLVTADDSPVALTPQEKSSWPEHADYSAVKEMHGFGYYVIEKNDQPEFIKNPNYKELPDIIVERPN